MTPDPEVVGKQLKTRPDLCGNARVEDNGLVADAGRYCRAPAEPGHERLASDSARLANLFLTHTHTHTRTPKRTDEPDARTCARPHTHTSAWS